MFLKFWVAFGAESLKWQTAFADSLCEFGPDVRLAIARELADAHFGNSTNAMRQAWCALDNYLLPQHSTTATTPTTTTGTMLRPDDHRSMMARNLNHLLDIEAFYRLDARQLQLQHRDTAGSAGAAEAVKKALKKRAEQLVQQRQPIYTEPDDANGQYFFLRAHYCRLCPEDIYLVAGDDDQQQVQQPVAALVSTPCDPQAPPATCSVIVLPTRLRGTILGALYRGFSAVPAAAAAASCTCTPTNGRCYQPRGPMYAIKSYHHTCLQDAQRVQEDGLKEICGLLYLSMAHHEDKKFFPKMFTLLHDWDNEVIYKVEEWGGQTLQDLLESRCVVACEWCVPGFVGERIDVWHRRCWCG